MDKDEALRQLRKMQGEIADRLQKRTLCVCNDAGGIPKEGEVPDEVIDEMWKLLADGYLYRRLRGLIKTADESGSGRRLME